MTYTFKLSRRLAASQRLGMLSFLTVVAACAGDMTAPDVPTDIPADVPAVDPQDHDAVIDVTPDTLTLEVDQTVRFVGQPRDRATDSASVAVEWSADGGTISPDGVFSASSAGVFKVVGRGRKQADTSIVQVVVPQPTLASITVSPATVSLEAGAMQQFAAVAKLSDGTTATVGLVWSAAGGTVDAAGKYTAGSTAGQYRVVVANTEGTVADTAVVTVTVPAPAPAPAPAPVLASVTLTPGLASLSTGATQQFRAYGRMSNGDSVAVAVTYSATGGTITSGGLYAAGTTGGTYRVIATAASGPADTTAVTLTAPVVPPPPSPAPALGLPYGAFTLLNSTSAVGVLNFSFDSYSASDIVTKINSARTKGMRLLLAMTGGAHSNYLTNGVFDRAKWNAKMETFNTSTIKSAIAAGVSDGTIVGASVMDEPNVSGAGDGNTWGPVGTMTKLRVDSLCAYVKNIFPTLPAGVVQRYDVFEPTKSYQVCDFMVNQYSAKIASGNAAAFRDGALAMGQRDHMAILFSLNILDGGTPDTDGTVDCTGTGGLGTYGTNCRMTAQQVRDFGRILGPAGCGLLMWRYDATFMSKSDNLTAFGDVASVMATAQRKACKRS